MNLEQSLSHYFGYSTFREGQKAIIEDLMNGKDVLAMLPTGAGKSVCFQLPAFILSGVTIVVSPLLSLMEDQVQQLKTRGYKHVVAINRFLLADERKSVLKNIRKYKLIYVSPEILQSKEVMFFLRKCNVSLFVVDEAHCISQWGHEFRTDYLKLPEVRRSLGNPPCLAITATATKDVQKDIINYLKLTNHYPHIYSVDRKNISMYIEKLATHEEKVGRLIKLVQTLEGPGIIYVSTRKWAEELSNRLIKAGEKSVAYYHGGMADEDRMLIQQQYLNNQLNIICCTNAFGMGVNKSNIRFVIHLSPPLQVEAYLQEIGRAGRDGKQSVAFLLYSPEDYHLGDKIQSEFPSNQQIEVIIRYLCNRSTIDVDELTQLSGMSDTTWRFLHYQLEKLNLYKDGLSNVNGDGRHEARQLYAIIQARIDYKMEKFRQFISWVLQDKTCRREKLLKHFGEKTEQGIDNCCDICGINMQQFEQKNGYEESGTSIFWQEELKKIFQQ